MGFGFAVFRAVVGDGEGQVAPAESDFAGIGGEGVGVESGGDRGKRTALQPGGRLTVRAQRGFKVHGGDAVERVELDVVFAGPNYFDRLAGLFGKHRCFDREVRKRLAAETAAEQRDVNGDIFFLCAYRGGHGFTRALRILRGGPNFDFAVLVAGKRSGRLHGRMREHRRVVFGFYDFSALRERFVHVADFAHHLAGFAAGSLEFRFVGIGVVGFVFAGGPLDFEFFLALYGRPGVVGEYGYTAVRLKEDGRLVGIDGGGLSHARNGQSSLVVDRLDGAAEHRRMGDVGIEHSVHARIDTIDGFAADHVLQVVAGNAFAHVAPLAARLQLEFFLLRHGELCSGGGQFAVGGFSCGLAVHDFVSAGGTFRLGYAPVLRCGAHQHESCRGAGLAQRFKRTTDGVRAIRVLIAVLFVTYCLYDFYAIPVGVEFVGNDAGQGGLAAAAHFRAMRDGVDGAVGVDGEINARRQRAF